MKIYKPEKISNYSPVKSKMKPVKSKMKPVKSQMKPIPLKNLSWSQAKVRFPNMKPFGDADKDGLKNMFDCKPFDIKRQGFVDIYGKEVKEVECKECGGETRTPIQGYCMGCAFQKGLIK